MIFRDIKKEIKYESDPSIWKYSKAMSLSFPRKHRVNAHYYTIITGCLDGLDSIFKRQSNIRIFSG